MINKIQQLLISCITLSFAQDYFPMHMGDWWEFQNSVTGQHSQYTIIDTPTVFGKQYFRFEGTPLFNGLYLKDSLENLLVFNTLDSTCCDTIYKLNTTVGDTWVVDDTWDPPTIATYVGLESNGDKHFNMIIPYGIEAHQYLEGNWGLRYLETEGSAYYRTDAYVNGVYLDIIDEDVNRPEMYYTVFPNPFNPITTIPYVLPDLSTVVIHVYDIKGRRVNTLKNEIQEAGYYRIQWDGTNKENHSLSSGMYIIQMTAKSMEDGELFTKAQKVVLLK